MILNSRNNNISKQNNIQCKWLKKN
jgi:hypothetical protein